MKHDRPKVFVPQPIAEIALEMLHEYADVELWPNNDRTISIPELEAGCARNDYLYFYPSSLPLTASMIAANRNLMGIATDHMPTLGHTRPGDQSGLAEVNAAGIPFLLIDDAILRACDQLRNKSKANLMVSFLLNCAYTMVEADRYCRQYGYFQEMTMDLMGTGTFGLTVSLVGFDSVARTAVEALRGLGLKILYTDESRLAQSEEKELGVSWVASVDELLSLGDFISLHHYSNGSPHMGDAEFALMKPTAFFINVSSGDLVDQDALVAALESNSIAGAALDVYRDEPPHVAQARIPNELRKLKNTILTPHIGGGTIDEREQRALAIAQLIIDDIKELQESH